MYPINTQQSSKQPGQQLPESSPDAPCGSSDFESRGSAEKALETSSDPRAQIRISAFVESACRQLASPPLDQQRTASVVKAAEEVVTNIIRHAYHGRANGMIRVEADVAAERLAIRIWHRARDFDPGLLREAGSAGRGEGDGWRHGKFGVYIASQYTDDVQYFSDGQGTHCISLITNIRGDPP